MASDIGVARLVLASMQSILESMKSIIEVISDYLKTADAMKMRRKSKQRATVLLLELKTERALFMDAIAHVLKYHVGSLIQNRVEWANEDMGKTVKSALGSSLRPFLSSLQQLSECVMELARTLRIDDSDKVPLKIPNDSSHDGSPREVRSWSEAIKDPPGSSSIEAFYHRYSEFRLALTDKRLEVQLAEIKILK